MRRRADGATLVVVTVAGGLLLYLLLGISMFWPIFAADRAGESSWPWIFAAFLLGPLSGPVYYLRRVGMRAAQRRNGAGFDLGGQG